MTTPHPRVILVYKNFAAYKGISHIGLGVSAMKNAQMLNDHGIPAQVVPAQNNIDIDKAIDHYNKTNPSPLTNVIISAPWISTRDLRALAHRHKKINFAIVSHSNVGFLQADPNGVRLLREGLHLSQEVKNFSVAGNCAKFTDWLREAYGIPVWTLPNMYQSTTKAKPWEGNKIRIGSFGAVRPQKNLMSAAAAAVAISQMLNRHTEFFYSSGRDEGGSQTIANAIHQMTNNVHNFTLGRIPWRLHQSFTDVVRSMDLLIMASYTESFNMVTADAIDNGVAVVVSPAIYWAPPSWMANSDDVLEMAECGIKLLQKMTLRKKGLSALKKHNNEALDNWIEYLTKPR